MRTGTHIQDDPGIASRYLAGQLAATELQTYERYLLENPAAVSELEATARMKVGLASLRDADQLVGLVQAPTAERRWRTLAFVAAAAALLVMTIGMWGGVGDSRDATLVAAASQLLDRSGQPLASGATYALLRTRSSAYDAVMELPPEPRAIELRVRPETPADVYSVALSRIQPDGAVTPIGNVSELAAAADGFVRLYVDSSRLESGPYLLVIAPAQQRSAASTAAFRVRVIAPEAR